tara:strand:+ start:10280 stop:11284 length:1005 start_codon:yes stop_codon:yes gene_type:complete
MNKIIDIINKLYKLEDLTINESKFIFNEILSGNISDIYISSFLTALKIKGESFNEILGATEIMREKSKKILSPIKTVDTCGTGGDMKGTLNISTASALVAACAGANIAKHGNRSVSSNSGSADVLEKLNINIDLKISKAEQCLKENKFCFMFAPNFHNAMKFVGPVRKELSTRTIFNLLGPLLNPANAKRQILGVYDKKWNSIHSEVLKHLGSEHVLVVSGFDGLDEISLSSSTYISELKDNKIIDYVFNPKDIGYSLIKIDEIMGGDADYNAKEIINMLNGKNLSFQKIVEINAGAAIYVSGIANNIKEGALIANKIITENKVMNYIEKLTKY